jgi:uncharacterized protein (TIRG00374 family)
MKLAVNLAISFAVLGLCLWLVWPGPVDRANLAHVLDGLELATFWPYLAGYLCLLALTHFARAWRWNNLLAPLGVRIPPMRLLAISSVGFMAILALPARLGEFVRPALIRKKGQISASAALGTVAVERIVDGLMVTLLVFGPCLALRGPDAPGWMMPAAYGTLAIFAAALTFLILALRRPEYTVDLALRLSLARRLAPGLASRLEEKLLEMIRGFAVLRDGNNLVAFVAWSAAYWIANALSLWVLAQGMGLDVSVIAAFATMAVVAVGIMVPNSPGLIGQFQYVTLHGLSLYLGAAVVQDGTELHATALAFAIVHHALQVLWYVGMGALALASPYVSLSEAWQARKLDPDAVAGDHPAV